MLFVAVDRSLTIGAFEVGHVARLGVDDCSHAAAPGLSQPVKENFRMSRNVTSCARIETVARKYAASLVELRRGQTTDIYFSVLERDKA